MDSVKERFLGFGISILGSLIFAFLTWYWELLSWQLAVAVAVPFAAIMIAIYIMKSYSHIGIINWSKRRGSSKHFRKILSDARSSVDFLVSWGGSMPGLNEYWEKKLADMVNNGINIRILLIKPGSWAEEKRHIDGAQWVRGDIERTIRSLLSIKNERINPAYKSKFNIGLYSSEAVWAMCFIDNKIASIGFYGEGNGRDHPSLELKRINNKQTFFDAYKNQFEATWRDKALMHTVDDLERIIAENVRRSENGIIYALTGPSGAGKTTLACLLLSSLGNSASSVFTYTTRHQRSEQESISQYKFISKSDFEKMNKEDSFAVTTEYCGHKYAIRREDVFNIINNKRDLVLDTIAEPDRLKKVFGNRVVIIYLTALSFSTMQERISKRMENNDEEISRRLHNAKVQSTYATLCDYILFTDDDANKCLSELQLIAKEAKNVYISTGSVSSEKLVHNLSAVVIEEGRLPNE